MTLSYKPTPAQCRQLPLAARLSCLWRGRPPTTERRHGERAGGGQKGGWGARKGCCLHGRPLLPFARAGLSQTACPAFCFRWPRRRWWCSTPPGCPSFPSPSPTSLCQVRLPHMLAAVRTCTRATACTERHGLQTRFDACFLAHLSSPPLPTSVCARSGRRRACASGGGCGGGGAGGGAGGAGGASQAAARWRGWVRVGGQAGMLGWMGIGGKGWASPTCTAMWRRKRSGWWERGWACATPAYIVLSSGNAVHAVQAASMRHSPGQLDVCCHDAVLPLRYMPACRHGGRAAV